ncbi:MAG TPA: DegT/DnrJ/EryC1/StrS family aminotransferase [Candidatus Sulfotelmatobacter sp.]|nr:DegT/DnrJ/EryC1/StrS family aminotransferase [Candidatus Sulfotelmatobacter sp.]
MKTKKTTSDLAIFGGEASFEEKLHVGRPNIGDKESLLERMSEVVDRRWLTNGGPCVEEFEKQLRELLDVSHCEALCNATDGLQLAMRALEMSGEVIVPAFTFIATAHAVQWLGFTPVFCDVDARTHTIDPARIEELITPRTTGIVGVHLWGQPCDIEALEAIARRNGLKLLFDSAHAFNCSWRGRMIGNFGDAEVFSFHATKVFNTFEGGALATNDAELARRVQRMRNFGFAGIDQTDALGTNAKMSEASAAMGLVNLESLTEFVEVNRRNYQAYRRGLEGISGVEMLEYDSREKRNYHYVVLEIDDSRTALSRDELQEILWAENVLARRYFYPGCHRMEPYASTMPNISSRLPVTERLARRVLVLPTGTAVSLEQVEIICGILRFAVSHAGDTVERLRGLRAVAQASRIGS